MELLSRKGVHPFGALPGGLPVATTAAAAAFDPESRASEAFCLHGTSAPALLSLLANGVNERYSGSNAGTAFGDGIYLAEGVAKSDQYCAPDAAYDPTSELHRRLYGATPTGTAAASSTFSSAACSARIPCTDATSWPKRLSHGDRRAPLPRQLP